MRISDEERRGIARRLRTGHRQDRESQGTFIARMVKGGGRITALDVYNLPERLADLIDRPTCTVVSVIFHDERDEYEVELSCGHSIATTGSAEDLVFCPRCGAEVVPDGC